MCEYETSSMRCAAAIDELRKALAEFSQVRATPASVLEAPWYLPCLPVACTARAALRCDQGLRA